MTGCIKRGWLTKREAKAALEVCRSKAAAGDVGRRERRIYRCTCGLLHLTSTPHRTFDRETTLV